MANQSAASISRELKTAAKKAAVRIPFLVTAVKFCRRVADGRRHTDSNNNRAALDARNEKLRRQRQEMLVPESMTASERTWDEIAARAQQIRSPAAGFLAGKHDIRAAILTDVYMYNYYKDAFEKAFYVSPENYKEIFSQKRIDIFIYITCWQGINGEWRGHVNAEKRQFLDDIIDICNSKQIPTLFQSIEDPSNYRHFVGLAKNFKFIITSDADLVEQYKLDTGNEAVAYGEYGVNPLLNNPVGSHGSRQWDVFFAGSYPRRYKQRCQDMNRIFGSVSASGREMTIADRNSDIEGKFKKTVAFPTVYGGNILPAFPHELLQSAHKCFKVNVNLNSITRSSTMCAMRVYELQAQGSLVLSNYALSVTTKFPLIDVIVLPKDISYLLDPPHPLEAEEKREMMIRDVLSSKTAYDNIREWLKTFGLSGSSERMIRVLAICDAPEGCVAGQIVSDNVCVVAMTPDEAESAAFGDFDLVAFLEAGRQYGEHYLQDAINCFKFTSGDFVTVKGGYEADRIVGPVHEFTQGFDDPFATVFRADSLEGIRPEHLSRLRNGPGYAMNPVSMNIDGQIRAMSQKEVPAAELSVIVPVFNNGFFLERRCLQALLTNRRFRKFELILVDDGSTDPETLRIIAKLERRYPNVRVFRFPPGGSGSASRARNKGLELATAAYVTYLDPDNGLSPASYDTLLEHAAGHPEVDAVVGFQVKYGESATVIGRLFDEGETLVSEPRKRFIESGQFPVISTQCAVIKRDFLIDNVIEYVTGAVGQDTTFGYEVLALSKAGILFVNDCYLEYFSERAGSVTNTVDWRFFEKSLVLEKAQRQRFEEIGIWDAYRARRAQRFVENWYVPRLQKLPEGDYEPAVEIVRQIVAINGLEAEVRV